MNKRIAPEDFNTAQPKKTVDQLLREFHSSISYRTLEPRMAFDGAAAATAAAVAADQTHPADVAAKAPVATDQAAVAAPLEVKAVPVAAPAVVDVRDTAIKAAVVSPANPVSADLLAAAIALPQSAPLADAHANIVFIDQNVANIAQLVSTIDPTAEIILINDSSSGLEQIASHLAGRTNVGSIHIVSHGETGTLYLGTDTLTTANLAEHDAALAIIGGALSDNGDILIYGCDVGQGTGGMDLVRQIAEKTGADVAASIDKTGGSEAGGDWVLEATSGAIEAKALSDPLYAGVLVKTNTGSWTAVGATAANDYSNTTDGITTTVTFTNAGTSTFAATATNDTLNVAGPYNATSGTGGLVAGTFDNAALGSASLSTLWSSTNNTDTGTVTITFSTAVTNPVIHIDRIGGNAGGVSTSSLWTLTTPSATLTKVAGVTNFLVDPILGTITEKIGVTTAGGFVSQSNTDPTLGTGAGSVRVNGTFTTITFSVKMTGGNSGGDGLELAFAIDAPPVAVNDTFGTIAHDTPVTINAISNDTDVRGDALAVTKIADTSVIPGGPSVAVSGGTAALDATGKIVFTPTAGFTGAVSFGYTVSDANGGSSTATVSGSVTNAAPTLDLDASGAGTGWTATYKENSAGISITDIDAAVTDSDDANMASGSVVLTNKQTGDRLSIGGTVLANGSTGTINGITYTVVDNGSSISISLTGSATKAIYASTLKAITFDNTTDTPSTTARTINVTVNDGALASNTAVATINIDLAPDPVDDAFSGNEDTNISGNVLTNDTDLGTTPITSVTVATSPVNGTISSFNTTTGAFVYAPTANFNGTDTFTYTVTDANGDTKTATVTLTISPVNDAPVNTLPAAQSTNEDTVLSITGISVNDVDGTGVALTTTLTIPAGSGILNLASSAGVTVTGDGSGTIVIKGTAAAINAAMATIKYTPVADYNTGATPINLTISTSDGIAAAVANTLAITVTPVADIAADAVTTNEDTAVTFNPFANDTFENGVHTITAINGTAITAGGAAVAVTGGTVSLDASGNLTFTPNANYNGTAPFSYTVSSGGVTETANVTMTVTAVNDAPVNTLPAAQVTSEDTNKVISGVSVADVDNASLTTTLSIPAGSGTLSVVTGGGATITNNATGTVTISGTAAQINAAIASITYTPTADYNTGSPAAPINLTVATSDGSVTTSGTVAITVTPVADITNDTIAPTEDTALSFNVMAGTGGATADTFANSGKAITSVTQPAGGTVTFAANGTLTYTPSSNFNGTDTFTYTVTSGGVTETATVTVNVAAVNDAPVNSVPGAQTTNEDSSITFSSANGNAIVVADVDSNVTTTLTVANGQLTLGTTAGVTFTGNGTGTVTVSGTPAAVTAALAGLQFAPTPDWNGPTTLNVSTSDGTAAAVVSTVAITVSPVIDIAPDSQTTAEDTNATFNVLTNDTFAAGATVSSVTQPAHGTVTIGSGGNVTYKPAANYNGSDSFTYTVTSGGVTETTTVTMTVTAVNDAPTAGTPLAQTSVDNSVATYNVGALYSDVDGDTLTFTQTGLPLGLSINSATGQITGTIDKHASTGGVGGVYAVTVTATDPSGALVSKTFNWTVTNPAPIAGNDTFTGTEDTAISGSVLANDSDPDGDALSVVTTPVTGPTHGTLVLNSTGTFTYTPFANYNGPDSFTYTLKDADGATTTATVTLNINPVNDTPTISAPATIAATEDTTLTFSGANAITIDDPDTASITTTLTVTSGKLTLASGAGVTITGSGTGTLQLVGSSANITAALAAMTFDAPADYNGPATLTVTSTDGIGTNSSSIALNVAPVADITADAVTTNEETAITFDVLHGTNGATADTFSSASAFISSVTAGAHGTVTIGSGGLLTYTPNAFYYGTDTFTYTVTSGGVTETTTVTVTIISVNNIPTQALPAAQNGTEDTSVIFSGAKGNQIVIDDVDSPSITTTVSVPSGTLTALAASGVTISGNGSGTITLTGSSSAITAALNGLTYAPVADAKGTVMMTVATSDGGAPVTGTIDIKLAPVADIANDSATTAEDAAIIISVSSNDTFENPSAVITGVTNGANGVVTNNGNGTVTYTPNPNFNGTDTFTYTVTSGGVTETATVNVTVSAVNDPPVTVVPGPQSLAEDGTLVFSVANGTALTVADVDGDALTTTVSVTNGTLNLGSSSGVTVTGDGTGTIVLKGTAAAITTALNGLAFHPTADYNGAAVFNMTTSDGTVSVGNTVNISVTPVADIVADSIATNEDTAISFFPLANDTFENSGAALTSVTQGAHGSVAVGTGGKITYTPAANYNGPDSFTYTVASGGVTETTTVTVAVAAVNDPPVTAVPPGQSTNEDTNLVLWSAGGNAITVSDLDGDVLTVTLSGTNGLLTLGSTGGVTVTSDGTGIVTIKGSAAAVTAALDGLKFAPSADYNGPAAISVTTTDGTVTTSNTISINVKPVVDIVANSVSTTEDTAITFNVLTNDNFESSGRAVTSITQGASGTVSFLSDGTLVYTPNANFFGTDTFTYTVTSGGVTETTTVDVTVGSVNDIPTTTGLGDHINLDNQAVSFDTASSFADADTADTLHYTATGLPAGVTIDFNTGIISGTINKNASQFGPYTVVVTASDGSPGGTVSTSFKWTVTNPGPTANDDAVTLNEDTIAAAINVLGNDTDPDFDPLTVTSATAGNGTVVINGDGTIKYTPAANFNRTDTIIYKISDGNGGVSTASVTVTITPVNDAPVTAGLGDLVDNDNSPVTIDITGAFSDIDGDTLTYAASGLPVGLTLDPATGLITGTIDPSASTVSGDHSYAISVTASDGHGGSVTTAFTWRVLNLPPTGTDDFVTTPEDTPVVAAVLSNDHDPDNDPLTITEINGQPITLGGAAVATANGSVKLVTDSFGQQVLIYTPNANFNGVETLVYKSTDGNSGFDTATLTITVVPQNDAPTVDTIANLTSKDSDIVSVPLAPFFHDVDFKDGDTLKFSASGLPPGLSMDPNTGVVSGTIDHSASTGGPYTVVVNAIDQAGTGLKVSTTFVWNVTNPKPTGIDDGKTVAQGVNITATAATGLLSNDTDPDGDPLKVAAVNGVIGAVGTPVAGSSGGIFVINADGSYTFDQNHAFDSIQSGDSRVTTVIYRLSDGDGGFATATLTITVTGVNDAPVATSLPNVTTVDSAGLTINAAAAFSDIDGDTLQYTQTGLPAGLAIDPATGIITGTIDHSASQGVPGGIYHVTVYADDLHGGKTPVTFDVTVTNPVPTAGDDTATTNEDTVLNGSVTGNDSDPDGDPLTYAKASDPAHGTVTVDSLGNYTYIPTLNFHGTDSFTYTVTDSDAAAKTQTVVITVKSVNDAPVSTAITPPTNNDKDVVSLSVSGNFSDVDGDVLTFTAAGLPTGLSIDPNTGLITGTIDHLASGTVWNVTITAKDPSGATSVQTFVWNVVNPAPTAGNDTFSGAEDTAISGSVVSNDGDPDGDSVSWAIATSPSHGTVVFRADGTFTYTPDANYNGPDSFTYKIIDSQGKEALATVTLGITPVNDAPVAVNDSYSTNEDTTLTIGTAATGIIGNLTGRDSDIDGNPLTAALVTGPAHGTLTLNSDGTFTYVPDANYNGPDSFTYKVNDGLLDSNVATVNISVSPVNDAPVAVNDSYTTNEDTSIVKSTVLTGIAGNDTDVENAALTATLVAGPAHGTLTLNANGTFTYAPFANYNGPDSFTYKVNDGSLDSNIATVSITVSPVNDAPVATDDSYAVVEDTPVSGNVLTDNTGTGIDSDVDSASLTVTQFKIGTTTYPAGTTATIVGVGTVKISSDGSFTFTPAANYNGAVPLVTYTVSDGSLTDTGSLILGPVSPVNDAPVAVNDVRHVIEDTLSIGNVLTNDTDADGDTLKVSQFTLSGDPTVYAPGSSVAIAGVGTFKLNSDGSYSFMPALNYNGPVPVVSYVADDSHGGSDTGTLTLSVSAQNDPPVAGVDNVPVAEDTPATGNVLANDVDPEGQTLSVLDFTVGGTTYAPGSTATIAGVGTVKIASDGSFTFTPVLNYNGPVPAVSYTVSDTLGGTDVGQLNLGPVTAVNDAPIAVADVFNGKEDTVLKGDLTPGTSGQDSDIDGDTLVIADADGNAANGISPVTGPAHGTLVLNADGTFSYTPNANYNGTDSFTYRISDGHGGVAEATVTLNVAPVNDAPVAADGSLVTPEDQPFKGTLPTATDIEGDKLTYGAGGKQPSHGTVTISPDGSYVYTPNHDYNGPDTFTYTVTDGTTTVEKTVTVMVTPVNDAPVIATPLPPPPSVDGAKIVFDVSKFAIDADGDKLKFTATGLPPGLVLNPATGLITGTLTHDASQGGPYTVTLTIDDGHGGVATRTFSWPVKNPSPVATDDKATVKTGKSVEVAVLANDGDPDADPLTVTKAKAGNGAVEILADGSIKYTPKAGFAGTDTITYVVSDGNGGFAIASVTITVADDGYVEKAPIFGYNGPEHHDNGGTAAPETPYIPIAAEGAVVDAVFNIHELGSLAGHLTAEGAVLAAANGARSLDGVGTMSTNGAVVDTIRQERAKEIAHSAIGGRGFQIYNIDGLPGFSLRNNVPGNLVGLGMREQIIIESLVRDRTLILQITNTLTPGDKRIVDYRVTRADGTALPAWLDRVGKDLLIGEHAPDEEVINLRVEAVYSDGSTAVEEVRIQTSTGEIQPLKNIQKDATPPALFKDQLKARPTLSTGQIESLGRAIAR